MKQKILLLVYPTFSEFEVTVVASVLKEKYSIETVALGRQPVKGESGITVLPDRELSEIKSGEFGGIIVPGGDLYYVKDADRLFSLIKEFHSQKKLVASICGGGYVLAKAGLLEHIPYTVTFSKEQRQFLGCFNEKNFTYKPVVISGNVITAQGHAYVQFGLAVGEKLNALKEGTEEFYLGQGNRRMGNGI
ncbi:DJ-1/PfpI family protein [Pseudalkalibacillus caeni]|uniref:Glutamine amidotransferase n=1 Tax=Exobacillus caeni TaxID=2574798 RepID=A0A5R9FBE8_9BACL|nr:DJ-1/PfpI family protein [Pseudalkalibacillus caeni]TLS38213.1 glutamine amidotransferase [Pseudalkalibacillus caeni]